MKAPVVPPLTSDALRYCGAGRRLAIRVQGNVRSTESSLNGNAIDATGIDARDCCAKMRGTIRTCRRFLVTAAAFVLWREKAQTRVEQQLLEKRYMLFNRLEIAALRHIAQGYPNDEADLLWILLACVATKRENTGGGFFTDLEPDRSLPPIILRSPLGDAFVGVEGMQHGICCLVHLTGGWPTLLEGFALAPENTSHIDFESVPFVL